MLEQGHAIADYIVIRPLARFDSRREYSVRSEAGEEKLVQFSGSQNWSRSQRQAFHDLIKALDALNDTALGVPTRIIEQEGELFCLYPLPPGVPLQNSLSAERTVRAMLELLSAIVDLLEPAHQQQLFHGALSPHTVHLDGGQPYLADFSLAALVAFDDRTADEAEYASPEQIRGEPPGTAVDVYSLGCLFYALLTGVPPFSGDDAFAVGMQHLNDRFPALPESMIFCAELLQGMTAKVSSERFSLTKVRAQLKELLSREDIDHVPKREPISTPAEDEERRTQEDAMAMVARIEDQLRNIESATAETTAMTESQVDEELFLARPAQSSSNNGSSSRRLLPVLVGLIGLVVGFCLGALFFDLLLTRSDGVPAPTVFSVDPASPDFTNSTYLWLEGDLAGAERELKRLLVNFPEHPQIHNNLAAVAAVRGDIEAAREWLEQALVLDTQTATIYRNLGSVYAEIARDSYGRALRFDYEQAPLQLDIFTNQGASSSSLGADTIIAQVSPAADEGGAIEEVVASMPLPTRSDDGVPVAVTSASDDQSADVSAVNADKIESAVPSDETVVAPVEERPVAVVESIVPVPGSAEATKKSHEDPVHFLERWAAAWSTQDIEGYLAFYSADFEPAGGLGYDEWIRQRRERLQRPEKIMVTFGNVEIRREADGFVQLEVVQDYRSERYSDRTRKLFDLRSRDGRWEIERERSLELIYR